MPRTIVAGEPGESYENPGPKVLFQLIVSWHHSCGLCVQYDHRVGDYWPIPFHRSCLCKQVPILPGHAAAPFVDYRAEIRQVSRDQQAAIMGRSNLAMVEAGVVEWSDVVTPSRIRSLREVASRKRLTVEQMTRAGVTRGRAEEAWAAVHTGTHTAAERRRAEQVKALLTQGYTHPQIITPAARALGSRVRIAGGPTTTTTTTTKPTPRPGPVGFTPAAMIALARGLVRKLAERFGVTYRGEPHD